MKYINVFKQTYPNVIRRKFISTKDLLSGFIQIPCDDCDGTGICYIPEGEIGIMYNPENPCPHKGYQCVCCKGTGKSYVTL